MSNLMVSTTHPKHHFARVIKHYGSNVSCDEISWPDKPICAKIKYSDISSTRQFSLQNDVTIRAVMKALLMQNQAKD